MPRSNSRLLRLREAQQMTDRSLGDRRVKRRMIDLHTGAAARPEEAACENPLAPAWQGAERARDAVNVPATGELI